MSEFLPFSRPAMGSEELAAVEEVLRSGWITTGPKNQQLEQAFCRLTGNLTRLPFARQRQVCMWH